MIDSHPETSRRQTILKKTEHFVGVFAISPAVEAILFLAILPQYLGPLTNPDLYNNQMLGAYLVALTTGVGIDALASARTGEKFRPLLSVGKALGLALLTSYGHYNPEAIKSWGQAFDKLIHPPQTPTPPATPTFTPSPSPLPTETLFPSLTPSSIPPTMTPPSTFTPEVSTAIPTLTASPISPEQIAEAARLDRERQETIKNAVALLGIALGVTVLSAFTWYKVIKPVMREIKRGTESLVKTSRAFFLKLGSPEKPTSDTLIERFDTAIEELNTLIAELEVEAENSTKKTELLSQIQEQLQQLADSKRKLQMIRENLSHDVWAETRPRSPFIR